MAKQWYVVHAYSNFENKGKLRCKSMRVLLVWKICSARF